MVVTVLVIAVLAGGGRGSGGGFGCYDRAKSNFLSVIDVVARTKISKPLTPAAGLVKSSNLRAVKQKSLTPEPHTFGSYLRL